MLKVRARNSHSGLLLRIASEVKRTPEYHASMILGRSLHFTRNPQQEPTMTIASTNLQHQRVVPLGGTSGIGIATARAAPTAGASAPLLLSNM